VATELSLFGDYACDAASGDSKANAFTLIEFEDANEYSIFKKAAQGRSVRAWATRFEHGFSQLVDWAWRLADEGSKSTACQSASKIDPLSASNFAPLTMTTSAAGAGAVERSGTA
jgi:hypothetical protein